MLVTDNFVYVHMPKTGGTFVTSVLTRLHALREPAHSRHARLKRQMSLLKERWRTLPALGSSQYGPLLSLEPKHGTCHDIPKTHRRKPIAATIRNPFDWYVSQV
jgi:hypothetical protein